MAFALYLCFFIIFGGFVRAVLTSGAESCSTEGTQNNTTIIRCDFQLLTSIPSIFDFIVIYRCFKNKEYEILKFKTSACKTSPFDASSCDIPESGFTIKKINSTYIELEFKTQIDGIVFWGTSPSSSVVKHKNCLNLTGEVQSASSTTTEPPSSVHLDGSNMTSIVIGCVLGFAAIVIAAIVVACLCCQRLHRYASHAPGTVTTSQNNANDSDRQRMYDQTPLLLDGNTVNGAGMERNGSTLVCSSDTIHNHTTDTNFESYNLDVISQNSTDLTGAVTADAPEPADQQTVLDIELPTPVIESAGVPTQETAGALPDGESLVSIKKKFLVLPEDERKLRGNGRKHMSLPQDRSDGKRKMVSYVEPEKICFTD